MSPAVIATWLPIKEDVDEAEFVYLFFAELLKR